MPIIAAGGIVDGRGMAAAFALGAEGVTMGTRFVASAESPVHANYKNAIVAAPITGTVLTLNPPRAPARAACARPIRSASPRASRERLPRSATLDMLYVNGDVENTSGAAGESAGLIHELKSVSADRRRDDRRILARDRPAGGAQAAESRPLAAILAARCVPSSSCSPSCCCPRSRSPSLRRPMSPTAIAWPTSTTRYLGRWKYGTDRGGGTSSTTNNEVASAWCRRASPAPPSSVLERVLRDNGFTLPPRGR